MSGRSVSSFNFFALSGSRFLSTRFSVLLRFPTRTLRGSLLDAAPSQGVTESLTSWDGDDHVRSAMPLASVVVAVKGVVVALYIDPTGRSGPSGLCPVTPGRWG